MAARAYWSGHIRLSLVSLPVRLYPATSSASKLTLHKIHEPSRERVRYQNVVPDHGPVEREEIVKGYEYEKGRYVLLDPKEVDELKVESKKTIELVQFVEAHEIDAIYYDRPYFVVPDGNLAEEAFLVVRDALRASRKVGLGQVVMSGRERVAAVRACGRGLLLETLRYEDEVRDADLYYQDIEERPVGEEQLALAKELIERKTAPFDPGRFEDHYRAALQELIRAKLEDREPEEIDDRPSGGKVINLMEALKKSLADGDESGKGRKRSKSAAASATRKETKSSRSSGKGGGTPKAKGGSTSSTAKSKASGGGRRKSA